MNTQELLQFRETIVGQTRALVLQGNGDPAVKLEILMGLIASGDTSRDVVQGAYDTAQLLSDDSKKLNAMLDLVDAIDVELARSESREESIV